MVYGVFAKIWVVLLAFLHMIYIIVVLYIYTMLTIIYMNNQTIRVGEKMLQDIIKVHQLQCHGYIGIYEHEKKNTQPIMVNLEIYTDINYAKYHDDYNQAICYEKISLAIIQFMTHRHFNLLEHLAESLSEFLLKEFYLQKIILEVAKPQAIKQAQQVSIRIKRLNTDLKKG